MYTQCPDCSTAFRVTADILKQAAGKVRCGGCGNAFNALEYLSESMPERAASAKSGEALPELRPEPLDGDQGSAWRELTIRAVGEVITLELDGHPTSEVVDRHPTLSRSHGLIGLQLHEGDPMRVAFRNLRIRDLGGSHERLPLPPPQWIWITEETEPLQEAWFATSFELERWEGAGSGFLWSGRPGYHEASARAAWDRTLRFLREQLEID